MIYVIRKMKKNKKTSKELNKREKEILKIMNIARKVVIKEDIELLKALAKH